MFRLRHTSIAAPVREEVMDHEETVCLDGDGAMRSGQSEDRARYPH
jgi:hypothetical protein